MDTTEELAETLSEQGIAEFDSMFVPNEAIRRRNEHIKNKILSGELVDSMPDLAEFEQGVKKELGAMGMQRFVKPSEINEKTWAEIYEDFIWEAEVDVSGESIDRDAIMTTLTTVFQTLASNPQILTDPNMKVLFNKILDTTGAISPLELSHIPQPAPVGGSSEVKTLKPEMAIK